MPQNQCSSVHSIIWLRAKGDKAVIHPEMGRGQSNLYEAHFYVLPHFRAKSQSLCRYLNTNKGCPMSLCSISTRQ